MLTSVTDLSTSIRHANVSHRLVHINQTCSRQSQTFPHQSDMFTSVTDLSTSIRHAHVNQTLVYINQTCSRQSKTCPRQSDIHTSTRFVRLRYRIVI
ncbi:hypothetical protein Bpfe_000130 [Biomphalaria pfeifferi]|uniref:Uncharacterized protein n=1 Tax=Biomphalaria pfeifferi TaxID=112525 RepID=A0AAD8CCM2_BIOPF|nr:hypothetical protein Bpfe_000130 [Biomphalaria pfeifferi]